VIDMRGVLRRWLDERHYGFAHEAGAPRDIFVHADNVTFGQVREGVEIEFDVAAQGERSSR
jgi:cold shock CspA family protein